VRVEAVKIPLSVVLVTQFVPFHDSGRPEWVRQIRRRHLHFWHFLRITFSVLFGLLLGGTLLGADTYAHINSPRERIFPDLDLV
jgi:hypothetical protein